MTINLQTMDLGEVIDELNEMTWDELKSAVQDNSELKEYVVITNTEFLAVNYPDWLRENYPTAYDIYEEIGTC